MLVVQLKNVKSILSFHLCKLSVLSKGRSVIEIGEIANLEGMVNVVHLEVIVIGSLEVTARTMNSAADNND